MKKILIIDDDTAIAMTLRALLGATGYETLTAADGDEGLRIARESLPDAILLDLFLPRRDGFEVIAELKAGDATRGIPVLVLSSFAERPKQPEGSEPIPDERFIPKPIEPGALLEKIRSLFD